MKSYHCLSLLLLVTVLSVRAARITIGDGKCGASACDYGPNELNLAITDAMNGDEIVIFSDLIVDISTRTMPTDPDSLLTITKSLTLRSVEGERYSILVGPVGVLHLFSLRSCNIVFKDFNIVRNVDIGSSSSEEHHKKVKPKRSPECIDILIRKVENGYYNGNHYNGEKPTVEAKRDVGTAIKRANMYPVTCLVTSDIRIEGIVFIDNIHVNIGFDDAKIMDVYLLNNQFEAPTGVLIKKGATLMHIEIHFNKFLFAGYFNNEPKSLPQVNVTHNFWRPCPFRSESLVFPIGVQPEDNWLPYCVLPDCSHLGPVESSNVTKWGVRRGFSNIQQAFNELKAMLGKKEIINITITAPFLRIRRPVIIDQLTNIEGPSRSSCEQLCYPNSTYPTLFVDIERKYHSSSSEDSESDHRRRRLSVGIQSLGYSLVGVLQLDVLLADNNQFLWQRDNEPCDNSRSSMYQFHDAFDSEEGDWFTHDSYELPWKRGNDLRMESVFIRGGSAGVVVVGPNYVKNSPRLHFTTVVFYGQSRFAAYIANVVSSSRLSGLMIKGAEEHASTANGLILDGVGNFDVSFNYYAFMRAGMRLSYTTDTTISCSRYLYNTAAGIEFVGDGNRDNVINGVTFAQAADQEIVFSKVSNPAKAAAVSDVLSLGLVRPVSNVIQSNSGLVLPLHIESKPFVNSLNLSATVHQNISSVNRRLTTVNPSIFQITHYTPTFEQCKVDRSFDLLSGTLYSFTNVLDSCASHSSRWTFNEPMGKHAPRCRDIELRSSRVESDPSFTTIGDTTQVDWTCTSKGSTTNGASHTQLSIPGKSTAETVCVLCGGSDDDNPFGDVQCDHFTTSIQAALAAIRAGDTIIIHGICPEANLLIAEGKNNLNITSLGLGTAVLTPGVPPTEDRESRSITDVSKMQGADSVRRYYFLVKANGVSITKLVFNMHGFNRASDGRWFYEGQHIRFAGENKDDPFAYCAVWINGTNGVVLRSNVSENRFDQNELNNICTLYDCNTTLTSNEHVTPATAVTLFADVNRTFADRVCISNVSSNFIAGGLGGVLHEFRCPGQRPENPMSSLYADGNTYLLQTEFGFQTRNILGRISRNDSSHTNNVYVSAEVCTGCTASDNNNNREKKSTSSCTFNDNCLQGELAHAARKYELPVICDRLFSVCQAQAQLLLGSANLVLEKEKLLLGSRSRIASANVTYADSMFADTSTAIVGDQDLSSFHSSPAIFNITMRGMFFYPEATVSCVFNGEVSILTGKPKKLLIMDSTVNGRNVFNTKQFCENALVGITLLRTRDHMGQEIYSERGSQPGQKAFNYDEFVDSETLQRRFCEPHKAYKSFQSGGVDLCSCNFIQQFERLQKVNDPNNPGERFVMLNECPPDKMHDPKNLFKCIPRNETKIIIVKNDSKSHDHHRRRHRSSDSESDDVIRPPAWIWLIVAAAVGLAVLFIVIMWVNRTFRRKLPVSTGGGTRNAFSTSKIRKRTTTSAASAPRSRLQL